MRDVFKIALGIFLGVVAVASCVICLFVVISVGGISYLGYIITTPSSENYLAAPSTLPTPSLSDQILNKADELSPSIPWGKPNIFNDLEITPLEYELKNEYTLESKELVTPQPGATFLWVHVSTENIGENADTTGFIFQLYYKSKTIGDTSYYEVANRQSFQQWEKIYPGQRLDGWVLFEVPQAIDLSQTYFLVKPFYGNYTAWFFSGN